MKKLMKPTLVLLTASFLFTSCMGSFALSKKLYDWNDNVTSNKFVNNLVFWLLAGIGGYGVTMFIDYAILNLIEFWSGNNPIAFAPGFEGTDRMVYNGTEYELERSSDRLIIRELNGNTLLLTRRL